MTPVEPNPNDFARLQRLLALKRHETPPPGFFDRFPEQVRDRIARADASPEPWWRQWWESLSLNPMPATAYAVVASLLVLGVLWLAKSPASTGNPQLAVSPAQPVDTNQVGGAASNVPPAGLFRTPSLPVQPAEFKK